MKAFGIGKIKRTAGRLKVFKLSVRPNSAQRQPKPNQAKRRNSGVGESIRNRNCAVELQKEREP